MESTYSPCVASRAHTSGTEKIWADSGAKTAAVAAVSTVLVMEPRPTVSAASVPAVAVAVAVAVGVGVGVGVRLQVQAAELFKPHIGGSVCPSTSSSFSVPIQ